ncbi:CDP-diacylglycerol--glycerol-3-phosphate 3-phosphatidyltransferase [Halothermothrix orenii]|uniref:CDP-diacylglycerol--glycerol-3-phosphate 3-phosphatidyltransferase n=1 Tax=Halothermothrix orenii (strain H 168 / OCM 544 / DSM 9562) TaxID=373903 RepID=B8CXC7_HALOH|nr:CDP-diacylglycerol--glycerol-3-phosphate 3-phosphatidyltransferase [Halothermothrix orenii]ACL69946.1 CDP-diacylglycerol--glycerol-3-phosphate 3-phosphatidyltransferase [Halothermothrix orenii H 168]
MNLPNKLTLTRIILVPVFMGFLFLRKDYPGYAEVLALITFVVAAVTDGLDGYLARKHKIVTKFGKIVDPLADKLLISAALISFVAMKEISAWAAIIIIGRELAITGLRVVAASEGSVISASYWGKWKTTLQIIAIIALILDPEIIPLPFNLSSILLWVAVTITVISGIMYFKNADIDFFKEEKDE